jgi:hypothetical protein
VRQDFRGNVGQVVNGTVINSGQGKLPPDDPEISRICPQCDGLTWRFSRHCVHCSLDLALWDHQQARAHRKHVLTRRAQGLTALGLTAMAASSFLSSWPIYQSGIFLAGLAALVLAGQVLKVTPA